ncbi:fungal class II heme-containing peroxidase [Coniosporium apollinis]|uniref:Peroxidase n=2 Tax=Coniosporium TaxID=2810619 RepID=A0ABQ9P143_9PEZI|nr:fungal class II heme-containing peroxidase [Cladosporium sp. JES 115]KAJ9668300.1 fungal class II heme-containing peroxidase [Coniosporium apollinis]
MRFSTTFALATAATTVHAISFPDVSAVLPDLTAVKRDFEAVKRTISSISIPDIFSAKRDLETRQSGCPAVWTTISKELTGLFLSNGQCNDAARAAIRASFHDCGTWNKAQGNTGGCDGSLILAGELERPDNNGLQGISATLLSMAQRYKVGVADMIAFAGNHATVTCSGGPKIKTYVGRKDSTTPNPDGFLPDVRSSGESLFKLFQDKGFDAVDLAALLGAHSTSKQRFVDPSRAGQPQDSTPGVWDVKYYAETLKTPAPNGVFVFESDRNLANHATVGKEFKGMVDNQGKWNGKYAQAMERMTLLGVPSGSANLIDCTNALPKVMQVRDMRAGAFYKPRN